MGLVKRAWIEEDERGWSAPDEYVCANCVEDSFLKKLVIQHAEAKRCNFCGRRSRTRDIAAPIEALMPAIAGAVSHFFSDPGSAMVPWDDGYVIEGDSTLDMLDALTLEGNDKFIERIAEQFHNTQWVPTANGHWMSSQTHQILNSSWSVFVHTVKHHTRFHFRDALHDDLDDAEIISPGTMLEALGNIVLEAGLITSLEAGTKIFRARIKEPGDSWGPSSATMGRPPSRMARAGRMNPAGISYLYTAFEQQTAIAETVSGPPTEIHVATFELSTNVTVLNLCDLPPVPSIFDNERLPNYEQLLFLHSFVDEIAQPIRKDGGEHIDYVPSQVVSEWFAHACSYDEHESPGLDGLMYPSAVRPGGRNLVLFPPKKRNRHHEAKEPTSYVSAEHRRLADWKDLLDAIAPNSR